MQKKEEIGNTKSCDLERVRCTTSSGVPQEVLGYSAGVMLGYIRQPEK